MKKSIAFLFAALLVLVLSACGQEPSSAEEEVAAASDSAAGVDTEQGTEPIEPPTISEEDGAELPDEDPVPAQAETPIEWTTVVCHKSDGDGYQYEIEVKLSPWILLSNTSVINSAWDAVSHGYELPTYNSWGVDDTFGRPSVEGRESDFGQSGYRMSCSHGISDMYYCVGTIQIKNITDGWSIDSNNPRSPDLVLKCKSYKEYTKYAASEYLSFTAGQLFAGDNSKQYIEGVRVSPLMNSDYWGPVPFVLMAAENFSPNTPDGGYYDFVLNDLVISSYIISDFPNIRPGIIGRDGAYALPTKSIDE